MKSLLLLLCIAFIAFCLGAICAGVKCCEKIDDNKKELEKYLNLFHLMCRWVKNTQNKRNLKEWFEETGYFHIAVYGMGEIGECLVKELEGSKILVEYAIDQSLEDKESVKVFRPSDNLPKVDCIVVTPITYFDEIEDMLQPKVNCPIISIEDVIYVNNPYV